MVYGDHIGTLVCFSPIIGPDKGLRRMVYDDQFRTLVCFSPIIGPE
jgi:hypothetical protein